MGHRPATPAGSNSGYGKNGIVINGNDIGKLENSLLYNYQYDQLNRLIDMNVYKPTLEETAKRLYNYEINDA